MQTRPALSSVPFVVALLASACAGSAYDVHAYTALSLHSTVGEARRILDERHRDALRDASTYVQRLEDESDDEYDDRRIIEIDRTDQRWRRVWASVLEAQAAAAHAVNAYSRGVYAALTGSGLDPAQLRVIGAEAVRAVASALNALRQAGVGSVPELPAGLAEMAAPE